MQKTRGRLSYANVVATLALFIAVGGASAFAATQLAKNSVGSKQLKKNSVTAAKIKNGAVTGAKVNVATLGAVPIAESLTPLEAVHLVGAPGQPPFESGSGNAPAAGPVSFLPVGFYKDHEGIVHLQGTAKVGPTAPGAIFTLPPGFRPAAGKLMIQEAYEAPVQILGSNFILGGNDLSGKLLGSTEKTVDLDGITFRAES